jgi:two-component system heavy metal sensor histidine kinase CusS
VNVGELLSAVREYYEATASDGGVSLIAADSREPITAALDRPMMLRAVSNLVSNAIAHTPRGGSITLAASAADAEIWIHVSDTGAGIPTEALPRVFDRFFRVDASRSRASAGTTSGGSASGGTGLGLAIVQSIMTLHGGSAAIASQPGRGTCVTLRMPLL